MKNSYSRFLVSIIIGTFVLSASSKAATIDITSNTNWTAASIGAGDDVVIKNGAILTVNTGVGVCNSIQIGSTNAPNAGVGTLIFGSTTQVTVTHAVTMGMGANTGTINMAAGGTLICESIPYTSGSLVPGSGTLQLTSTTTLPSAISPYYNLVYNAPAGVLSLGGAITCNGNMTITNGTITTTGSNYDLVITGILTIASGQSLTLNGSNLTVRKNIANDGNLNANTSTTIFDGLTTMSGSSSTTLNNVIVNSGKSLTLPTSLSINGNWTDNGGVINYGTNTLIFTGTGAQAINGTAASQRFYNLALNKTPGTTLSVGGGTTTLIVNSFVETTGDFTAPATMTINSNYFQDAGTYTAGVNTNIARNWTKNGGLFFHNNGTVTFNGGIAQSLGGSSSPTFYNLTVNKAGGALTQNIAVVVDNKLTMTAGIFSVGSYTLNGNGGVVATGGNLQITKGATTVPELTGVSTAYSITGGILTLSGAGAQILRPNVTYYDLVLSNSGTKTITNVTNILGSMTVSGSAKFGSNSAFTVAGTLNYNTTASTTLSAATDISLGGFSQSSGTFIDNGVQISMTGSTWTRSGGTFTSTGKVYFNSAAGQSIGGISSTTFFKLYKVNVSTLSVNSATVVNNELNIASGIVSSSTNSFSGTAAVNMSGGELQTGLLGATVPQFSGAYALTAGMITLNGAGAQTAKALNYYNLCLGGAGAKSFSAGTTRIAGSITTTGGVGDALTNSALIEFNGIAPQAIDASVIPSYFDLTINNSTGVTATGAISLYNTITLTANSVFTNSGTFTLKSDAVNTARIAQLPVSATFAGNITMERYLPATNLFNGHHWHMVGAPVNGSGFQGVVYDETVSGVQNVGYVPCYTCLTNLGTGVGGFRDFGAAATTYTYSSAPPNTGNISVNTTMTASNGVADDGWNLITNPYPSEIVWNSGGITLNNVGAAAYMWNGTQYQSFLLDDGISIPSCQGIWVKATANGSVGFHESAKVATNPAFLRMASSPYPKLVLKMTGSSYYDVTDIRFRSGATENFDSGFDALKLGGITNAPYMSSFTNDNLQVSINTFPEMTQNFTIPVIARCTLTGTYALSVDYLSGFAPSSCIYLQDLVTGNQYDLKTLSSFDFDLTGNTSDAPRFLIHFAPPVSVATSDAVCTGGAYLGSATASGQANGPWAYTWKDSGGNIIKSTPATSLPDSIRNRPAGTYFVTLTNSTGNCTTITEPVIIGGPSSIAGNAVVTNTSCYGTTDGTIDLTSTGGFEPLHFTWSNSMHTEDISALAAGTYSVVITDSNNCSHSEIFVLSSPPQILPAFTPSASTVYLSNGGMVVFTNTSAGATNYLWNFGDGSAVNNSISPAYLYLQAGVYTVTLTASSGACSNIIQHIIHVETSPNGITDYNSGNKIVTYSREHSLVIDFNFDETKPVSIFITDMLGQNLYSEENFMAYRNSANIDMRNYSAGIYLVRVLYDGQSISRKLFLGN